ncbi:hypothetical protein NC651_012099 [Populus alba x Populus x berolinensis]|nr:hypothetical protein NC651_012099 [Populus alba x Populus x berolinensis]
MQLVRFVLHGMLGSLVRGGANFVGLLFCGPVGHRGQASCGKCLMLAAAVYLHNQGRSK